jgi:valyl-tRNA synthetase
VRVHAAAADLPPTADGGLVVMAAGCEAHLAQGGADVERERDRLERELAEARRRLAAAQVRLANADFAAKAPAAVVDGARVRVAELRELVRRLEERLRS